jgi:two-component system, chemotaxis family, protein-glutamate methylesterase/glutaminase
MALPNAIGPPPASAPQPLRVMIVDDAVVVRGLIARWLTDAGGIQVVSTHRTGAEAVAAVERIKPDVIILDIEMPDMDGITALPLLKRKHPEAVVIMASTLTTRNADISLKCLSLGAVDYIPKPSTNRDLTFSSDFRRELVDKIKTLGHRPRHVPAALRLSTAEDTTGKLHRLTPVPSAVAVRPMGRVKPNILVIGASTGGPNAIIDLLKLCRPALHRLPILIAQHMPVMFTAMFAEHLRRQLSIDASEAVSGEAVEKGRVYIAPGGKHMRLERVTSGIRTVIDDSPPVNFCKPAVDVTFISAANTYGPGTLATVLTGMGSDGLRGAAMIVEKGGNVLAQDEASSVVWGMPGSVAKNGLCAAVEPIARLAQIINAAAGGPAP